MSAGLCYCGLRLKDDGTCRFGCPPEARPSLLRAKAKREREARAQALSESREVGTRYRGITSAACAKFDPVVRHNRERTLRAVRKSHAPGARR